MNLASVLNDVQNSKSNKILSLSVTLDNRDAAQEKKHCQERQAKGYNIFFKYGPILASFCLFLSFSHRNSITYWKELCLDSNPGPQYGRHRWIHWSMTAAHIFLIKMGLPWPLFSLFLSFQTNITNVYNNKMWKNVHPVYSAGVLTPIFKLRVSSHNHKTRAPALLVKFHRITIGVLFSSIGHVVS